MKKKGSRSGNENWVLSRLARDDLALLMPHLVGVDLPLFTQLETGPQADLQRLLPRAWLRFGDDQWTGWASH